MSQSSKSASADVIVVGGGAVGCASAYLLALEGLSVLVLERTGLASEASGAAAGMLAPIAEANAPGAFLRFGLESLRILPTLCRELRERSGVDPEYIASGLLQVARDEDQARALQDRAAALGGTLHASPFGAFGAAAQGMSIELEWLDADEIRRFDPSLHPDVVGGLWSPAEAQVRSPLLTRAYAGAAESLGARIETGVDVTHLCWDRDRVIGVGSSGRNFRSGAVVLCAGCWTGDWLAAQSRTEGPALLPLRTEPERGQLVVLDASGLRPRSIVWGGSAYLVPKRDGSVIVGATQERVGFDRRVTAAGVAELLSTSRDLVPQLAGATFRTAWAGLRPTSEDGHATIGPVSGAIGLFVASGHHRNGVMLSAITARLVRDHVLGKRIADDAKIFDPLRWI